MKYKVTYRSGPDYTKRKTTIQSFRSGREIMDFERGMRQGGASHIVITQLIAKRGKA